MAHPRVLVIGGTGFIGRPVVQQLLAAGSEVLVVHRGSAPLAPATGLTELVAPRDDLVSHHAALEAFAPKVVVDIVAYTEQQARDTCEQLGSIAKHAIVLSSADVYEAFDRLNRLSSGPVLPSPFDEGAPLRERRYPYRGSGLDVYEWIEDYDKILVEKAYRDSAFAGVTAIRLPFVIGPGDNRHRLRDYLAQMDKGAAEIVLGESIANWRASRAFVENVAALVTAAVLDARDERATFHYAEEPACTECEWVEHVGRAAGWNGRVSVVPDEEAPVHEFSDLDCRHEIVFDLRRFRERFGCTPPMSFEDSLRAAVAAERSA